ncbi:hypothetical protein FQN57_003575 [Myotisia sp. PD_48]|nr:hypothetical protein FQN57_003575 [Myotisia sp. PD_48]
MAPPPNTPAEKPFALQAIYQSPSIPLDNSSPSQPQTVCFRHPLNTSISLSAQGTPATRTAYLAELRGSVSSLQAELNAFLTEKMDEDKRLQAQSTGAATLPIDDVKEEEYYGEEVVDDDDE